MSALQLILARLVLAAGSLRRFVGNAWRPRNAYVLAGGLRVAFMFHKVSDERCCFTKTTRSGGS